MIPKKIEEEQCSEQNGRNLNKIPASGPAMEPTSACAIQ